MLFTTTNRKKGVQFCYSLCLLYWLLVPTTSATPFLQRIRQATPANRVNMVLNHFDTSAVLTKNQAYAFRLLDTVRRIGEQTQEDRKSVV